LDDEYTGILLKFLKILMGSLFAFEKRGGLSSSFWKASRAYKGTFQKWGEVCRQLLKT